MLWAGFLPDLAGVFLYLLTATIRLSDCPKAGSITFVPPCSMCSRWPTIKLHGTVHRDQALAASGGGGKEGSWMP